MRSVLRFSIYVLGSPQLDLTSDWAVAVAKRGHITEVWVRCPTPETAASVLEGALASGSPLLGLGLLDGGFVDLRALQSLDLWEIGARRIELTGDVVAEPVANLRLRDIVATLRPRRVHIDFKRRLVELRLPCPTESAVFFDVGLRVLNPKVVPPKP